MWHCLLLLSLGVASGRRVYVSSYYYMCPHTTIHVAYYYICVLISAAVVSWRCKGQAGRRLHALAERMRLAGMRVLWQHFTCRYCTTLYLSSYCYICVLILLYMCPHTTICLSSYHCICLALYLQDARAAANQAGYEEAGMRGRTHM